MTAMLNITIKEPTIADGQALWNTVKQIPELDLNSSYCYYLIAHHFSKTSALAFLEGEVCGFVTGYLKPEDPSTLFVWQMGVSPKARKQGLAVRMIKHILSQKLCKNVSHIEATTSESNVASLSVFKKIASHLNTPLEILPFLSATEFPEEGHKDEMLLKLGPFDLSVNTNSLKEEK